ncbi:hypothetical protein PYW07_007261 [Mythimna separata]|uniref:Uncharacterized protein n=1 Tax=Mythimna separata TaxID=271217 RepID=A0AAD8E1A1_MYTSE|nr:hypothetical protein PYW07_007261 [Mythimna separata]
MNDFAQLEKTIVRELSCRLCLCTDVVKLKPLSAEVKRKIRRLFDILVRTDDNLPKAICHDCLQQVSALHLYHVKVEKTQKFLEFHKMKMQEEKREVAAVDKMLHPIITALSNQTMSEEQKKQLNTQHPQLPPTELQQGDTKPAKLKAPKKKALSEMKYMESMTLEEFAHSEQLDKNLLSKAGNIVNSPTAKKDSNKEQSKKADPYLAFNTDNLDPTVLLDGKPAKQGAALDRQITLFYKMECCICHQTGFHFRSLMKHYKERHGVPGYVSCCDKKFHYFYPKKIIEHMAFHLQPNIFMCPSCHQNFQTSQELYEHQSNGGRSEGKIVCPRCSERYPTYHELGLHIVSHRGEKLQCDYCGKLLKHHHRKKTVNHMEDVILCSQCIKTLKSIEKSEKEIKEKVKAKVNESNTQKHHEKFKQAMGLSGDEDASTD